jgi:hypothetical protein
LYFLSLVGSEFCEYGISNDSSKAVIQVLEAAALIERKPRGLAALIRSVKNYVRRMTAWESAEAEFKVDPTTGLPIGVAGRITFREPTSAQHEAGLLSADEVFKMADDALGQEELQLWLLLDRLDVAFAGSPDLEANALRALFRVYIDQLAYSNIRLKIFLREDIYRQITATGFREASHITRDLILEWDEKSLLNLVVRRMVRNPVLLDEYASEAEAVLHSTESQSEFFYKVFPPQVDTGSRKPATFNWMLSRTHDGTNETAPRELIHLLESTRLAQIRRIEIGERTIPDGKLFSPTTLKEALPEVSKTRLEQTLFAEYPGLKRRILALDGAKTDHDLDTLQKLGPARRRRLSQPRSNW